MATLDNMASDEEQIEEDLLIEALHQHLAYVEARLREIGIQIQQDVGARVDTKVEKCSSVKKVKKKQVLPPIRPPPSPPPLRLKPPRASELTKIPTKPKVPLTEKEKEILQKAKMEARQKELKQLSVLEAVEKLKVEYRHRYTDLMERHVAEQHREVKEKDRVWKKKMAKRQEKEKKLRLQRKPPSFRSSAVADYTFLQNLHQTTFYKIVSIELELRKKGMLTSLQDLKQFWDEMLLHVDSSSSNVQLDKERGYGHLKQTFSGQGVAVESPVLEVDEDDEEGSSHSWAITALPQRTVHHKPHVVDDPSPQSSLVFKPTEMPRFKPLHQMMQTPSNQKDMAVDKHSARVEAIQRKSKSVENMFHVAKSNELVMGRLMEFLDLDPILALPEPVGGPVSSVPPLPMTTSPVLPPISVKANGERPSHVEKTAPPEPTTPPTAPPTTSPTAPPTTPPKALPTTPPTAPPTIPPTAPPTTPPKAPPTIPPTAHSITELVPDQDYISLEMTTEQNKASEIVGDQGPPQAQPLFTSVKEDIRLSKEVLSAQQWSPPVVVPLTMESLETHSAVKSARKTALWSNYLLTGQ